MKFASFLRASYDELIHKVTWPKLDSLQQSVTVVLVAVVIVSLVIWVMDSSSSVVFKFLYGVFR